jgi:phosphonate transport system substrate-binding protein
MRIKGSIQAGILAGLSLITPTLTLGSEAPKEINFGIISTETSQALEKGFRPFLDDMAKALGMKVNAFFASDYAGVIEGMRFGKVHVAWFGNKSAMEAVDRAGGEIFAQTVDLEGNPGYWSVLIVHKDSEIKSLEDVLRSPGKYTFGNGDPNSTSGFLVPSYYVFALNNVDPKTHFKAVRTGNHESNALAVATKQVDVATNNTESLSILQKRAPDKYEQIRVIWKSPVIPHDPLVWRKDLPEDLKAKIRDFVFSYGVKGPDAERQRKVLAGIGSGWAPFKPSDNSQLIPIRQLTLYREKLKIEADEKISQKEKEKKLEEIESQLRELQAMAQKNTGTN